MSESGEYVTIKVAPEAKRHLEQIGKEVGMTAQDVAADFVAGQLKAERERKGKA